MTRSILAVLVALLCGCTPVGQIQLHRNLGWSHIPVVVYVDGTTPEVIQQGVASAAEEWNIALGTEVFEVHAIGGDSGYFVYAPRGAVTVSSAELGSRLIDAGSYQHPLSDFHVYHILGEADVHWDSRTGVGLRCMVLLDYEVDSATVVPVATHELGHCLGLEHDLDEESIMFTSAIVSPGQHIMADDVARIQHAFR